MKPVNLILSVAAFIFPIATPFAAPRIEFDSKTFQCGTVIEGKTEKINAVFVVKNSGDAVLKLEEVRPGCGCTVVKYDTLIQPGKSAKIESSVNIQGYQSGSFSKSISVTSNAKNEPIARLIIEATIQSTVDLSELYLNLDAAKEGASKTIYLTTKKADFKINAIEFRYPESKDEALAWKSNFPLTLKFKLMATDSIRDDGYKVYKLEIFNPKIDKAANGQVIIQTNHPDKKEIKVYADISK